MELHAAEGCVIVDRAGVCSASPKGFEVRLSRASKIVLGDRRKRQQIDLVDLDYRRTALLEPSDLDHWSRPQTVRNGDGSVGDSIAKIRAELHVTIVALLTWVWARTGVRATKGEGDEASHEWLASSRVAGDRVWPGPSRPRGRTSAALGEGCCVAPVGLEGPQSS
jgi:hypothetical protein